MGKIVLLVPSFMSSSQPIIQPFPNFHSSIPPTSPLFPINKRKEENKILFDYNTLVNMPCKHKHIKVILKKYENVYDKINSVRKGKKI